MTGSVFLVCTSQQQIQTEEPMMKQIPNTNNIQLSVMGLTVPALGDSVSEKIAAMKKVAEHRTY